MQDFEEFLQEEFIKRLEYNGIPIIKDNCEDLFEKWIDDVDMSVVVDYAELWGRLIRLDMLEEQEKTLINLKNILTK